MRWHQWQDHAKPAALHPQQHHLGSASPTTTTTPTSTTTPTAATRETQDPRLPQHNHNTHAYRKTTSWPGIRPHDTTAHALDEQAPRPLPFLLPLPSRPPSPPSPPAIVPRTMPPQVTTPPRTMPPQVTTPPRRTEHTVSFMPLSSSSATFSPPRSPRSSPTTATAADPHAPPSPDYGLKAVSKLLKPSARQIAAIAETRENERLANRARLVRINFRELLAAVLSDFGYRSVRDPEDGRLGHGTVLLQDFCAHVAGDPRRLADAADYPSLGPGGTAPTAPDMAALLQALCAGTNSLDPREAWLHLHGALHAITVAQVTAVAAHITRHGIMSLLPQTPSMQPHAAFHVFALGPGGTATTALLQFLNNVLGMRNCAKPTPHELYAFDDDGHKAYGFQEHLKRIHKPAQGHAFCTEMKWWTSERHRELWLEWAATMSNEGLISAPGDLKRLDRQLRRKMEKEKAELAAKRDAERAELTAKMEAEKQQLKEEFSGKMATEKAELAAKLDAEKAELAAKLEAEKQQLKKQFSGKLATEKAEIAAKLDAKKAELTAKMEAEKQELKDEFSGRMEMEKAELTAKIEAEKQEMKDEFSAKMETEKAELTAKMEAEKQLKDEFSRKMETKRAELTAKMEAEKQELKDGFMAKWSTQLQSALKASSEVFESKLAKQQATIDSLLAQFNTSRRRKRESDIPGSSCATSTSTSPATSPSSTAPSVPPTASNRQSRSVSPSSTERDDNIDDRAKRRRLRTE
ncbi:hypothetical protein DFH27DRAFT_614711 [Peziza echinospora]|nr:hypothetical protein DFH27DRAFT_614711 [Peziza echinospora]